jgi:hypothetical protein
VSARRRCRTPASPVPTATSSYRSTVIASPAVAIACPGCASAP